MFAALFLNRMIPCVLSPAFQSKTSWIGLSLRSGDGAHNPKVAGSNPAPAIRRKPLLKRLSAFLGSLAEAQNWPVVRSRYAGRWECGARAWGCRDGSSEAEAGAGQGTARGRRKAPAGVERDFMEALTPERGRANADLADSLVAWHEWSFLRGGRPPRTWIDNTESAR